MTTTSEYLSRAGTGEFRGMNVVYYPRATYTNLCGALGVRSSGGDVQARTIRDALTLNADLLAEQRERPTPRDSSYYRGPTSVPPGMMDAAAFCTEEEHAALLLLFPQPPARSQARRRKAPRPPPGGRAKGRKARKADPFGRTATTVAETAVKGAIRKLVSMTRLVNLKQTSHGDALRLLGEHQQWKRGDYKKASAETWNWFLQAVIDLRSAIATTWPVSDKPATDEKLPDAGLDLAWDLPENGEPSPDDAELPFEEGALMVDADEIPFLTRVRYSVEDHPIIWGTAAAAVLGGAYYFTTKRK